MEQYGGFWIRLLALLTDSAILFVVSAVIIVAATFLGDAGAFAGALLVALVNFLYWPLMQASARQATFGKQLLGLKVAHGATGQRISILRSFGRELSKIISAAVFSIGFIIAAFTRRKQALHDLIAATVVVREGPSRVVAALVVCVAGYALPIVAVPLLIGGAMVGMLMSAMSGDAQKPAPAPQAQVAKPSAKPKPAAPAPAAKPAAPAPAAAKPEPIAAAPQPAPEPKPAAAEAKPAAKPAAVEEKPAAAAPKPAVAEPKPTAAARPEGPAPKPAAKRASAAAAKPVAPAAAAPAAAPAIGPPKFNDVMTAVLYRDAGAVSELLGLGKWPDKRDSRGATPLMAAAMLGDARIAELLLKGGANANASAPNGDTALSLAREGRHEAVVGLLQRSGAR
jgi:uncharacterized RDD family membrane protein YckC